MDDLSHYSKEVAKGSLWSMAGSVVFYTSSFFYVILIAHALSQNDIGLFFLALSVVSLGATFDNFGIGTALSRYVPFFEGKNEKGKIKSLLKLSYLVVTSSSIIFMIIFWALADFIASIYSNPALAETIRMLSIFFLFSNFFNINISYLRGRTNISAMQYSANLQNLSKLVLTALLFYFYEASLLTLIAGFLSSYVVSIFLSSFFVIRDVFTLPKTENQFSVSNFMSEIIPFGLMLSLIHSVGTIFSSANRMLLGYMVDPIESTQVIAIYAVAFTLANVLMALPKSIGDIFLPLISRLYGKKELGKICSITTTAQRWSLFLTIPFGIIMILFSGDILSLMYGESYRSGELVMSILTLGILFSVISYVFSLSLAAMKLVKIQLLIAVVSGTINLISSAIFILMFGMVGSAICSFIGFIISILLLSYYAKKYFNFKFSPKVLKLAISGILVMAIMLIIRPYLLSFFGIFPETESIGLDLYFSKIILMGYMVVLASISMFFFLISALILKCVSAEDVSLLGQAMMKARMPKPIVKFVKDLASHGVGPD